MFCTYVFDVVVNFKFIDLRGWGWRLCTVALLNTSIISTNKESLQLVTSNFVNYPEVYPSTSTFYL